MIRVVSFLGLLSMMFLAWLISYDRKKMNWRLIVSGVLLQFALAVLILWTPPGKAFFDLARRAVAKIVAFSNAGAEFIFGSVFSETVFAFSVLPTIIFVGSITAVLFHLGVLQFIVKIMAKIMVKIMDVSGAESLAASANVYVGMTEAPLLIKPYLETMTRSEIMAMMTGGMATIAGGVMAAYAMMGADAGHLLAASIMSAPASLVIAKIIFPEKEESVTKGVVKIDLPKKDANILDAACRGATDGLKLALNVGAMLIAFIAIVTMLNWMFGLLPDVAGAPLTLERMLGWFCFPISWLLGVDSKDAFSVGMLLGKKIILNEFLAYMDLVSMKDVLSERSFTIATYALCGFANFGSVAIQIGGVGTLVPERRKDFAELAFRAMLGGALAAFMTAAIAGILI
ncbi:hypothetical protein BVX94_01970 [bacterium B17]|nr:hypothetical protein BVX94_01970 [bacterium B17]